MATLLLTGARSSLSHTVHILKVLLLVALSILSYCLIDLLKGQVVLSSGIFCNTAFVNSLGGWLSAKASTPPAGLGESTPTWESPASAPEVSECLCLRTPMSAVGRTASTASCTVAHSSIPSCAQGNL